MKKILIVAVLLAVMLPLAAADRTGKWYVEVTAGFDQPSGMDTTYAYAYGMTSVNGNALVAQSKTFDVNTPRAWAGDIRFGYDAETWKGWISYYKFDKVGHSTASTPAGFETLFNTLPMTGSPFTGFDGFIYSDGAHASQETEVTRWDVNIGRKFKPGDKWGLLLYTGVKYFRLSTAVNVGYTDTFDYNYYGPGSQDNVVAQSRSNGWGLNAGIISTTEFNKWFSMAGGLEFSAIHATRNNQQTEFINSSYYAPYYGTFGVWNSNSSNTKVLPAASIFVEGQVNMGEHFYGKVGYKFTTIQNAFTYVKLANDYPFGGWGYIEQNKDLSIDGLYFTVGLKF